MSNVSYLLEGAPGIKLAPEQQLVLEHAQRNGIPVAYASAKQLLSKRVLLHTGQVPVGGISFVRAALQQFGLSVPTPDCYPAALRQHLHRELTLSTLGAVQARQAAGADAVFVKPAERLKRFTGFVMADPQDYRLATVSRSLRVWVASAVVWRAEWRVYVVDGRPELIAFYSGDHGVAPSTVVIDAMVSEYAGAGGPAGYALDVGVLDSGTITPKGGATALVEVNDGFSLGAYGGVSAEVYANLLTVRWNELLQDVASGLEPKKSPHRRKRVGAN